MMGEITSDGGVKISRQLKNESGYSPQQARRMIASGKSTNMMSESFNNQKKGTANIKSPQNNVIGQRYLVNPKGMLIEESKVITKGPYSNGLL